MSTVKMSDIVTNTALLMICKKRGFVKLIKDKIINVPRFMFKEIFPNTSRKLTGKQILKWLHHVNHYQYEFYKD